MQERCQAAKESHGAQLCALPKYQRYGAVAAARVLGSGGRWQVAAKYARYATYSFIPAVRAVTP